MPAFAMFGIAIVVFNAEARTALRVVEARMRELAQLPSNEVPSGEVPTRGRDELHAGGWILRRDGEGHLKVEIDLG